jgi:iron(III) transport system permease protein
MSLTLAPRRDGRWRNIVVAAGLALTFAPALPLLLAVAESDAVWPTRTFLAALLRGTNVAIAAALLSFLVGLPTGLALYLHRYPLRPLLIVSMAIALVLPSFLVAIGLSMLSGALWATGAVIAASNGFSAWIGTIWSLAPFGVSLVAFVTYAAARNISGSQIEAARLAGGERAVFREAARAVWPTSALAATFAGILTLSDAGPGLVFGHHGAAAEILTSFSAQYDFQQATLQCLLLTSVVALLAVPCAARLAPQLARGMLARDTSAARAMKTRWNLVEGVGAFALVLVLMGLPLLGFLLPLTREFPLARALVDVGRPAGYTVAYALSAGLISTLLGLTLGLAARHSQRTQTFLVGGLLVSIALPPAFTALGWVRLATAAPQELDWFMREGPLLALHLGLHLLPVATMLALRAVNAASPSWFAAATLHGIPPGTYLRRVLVPYAAPALWTALGAVALLGLADITSALLLHPPGRGTIPLTIFAVMANAPEAYVAALCLVYLAASAGLVSLCIWALRQWR